MDIPDEVRKCVCFVGYRNQAGEMVLMGTAFFVSKPLEGTLRALYCVTAAHVLEQIQKRGSDTVSVAVNARQGGRIWITFPLMDCLVHPDPAVDVAIIPGGMPHPDEGEHMSFPIEGALTKEIVEKEGIGAGTDVFVTGLFVNHAGTSRIIPIVRIGNIAAMPHEPVETSRGLMDAYLIEARSIGGLSGSPVFTNQGMVGVRDGQLKFLTRPPLFLLGLIHGHFDIVTDAADVKEDVASRERVNMGIAIVVPVEKIVELLNDPRVLAPDDEIRKERQAAGQPQA